MSRFSRYFINTYPKFKEEVLSGNYESAMSIYAIAFHDRVEGKKNQQNIRQVYSAAYDGFHRNGSQREQDLRGWIANDEAFDAFMEFFCSQYGKDGIYRVSNKGRHTKDRRATVIRKRKEEEERQKKEGPWDAYQRNKKQLLHKKQLRAFIRRKLKDGVTDKKKLFEATAKYIKNEIIASSYKDIYEIVQKEIKRRTDKFNGSIFLIYDSIYLRANYWILNNLEAALSHGVYDYLCWYAAKFINKRGTGKKIPTNSLTIALKKNLALFLLLDEPDMKKILRSFRFQKSFNTTEMFNAWGLESLNYSSGDIIPGYAMAPKNNSGPKTRSGWLELLKYRNKALDFFDKVKMTAGTWDKNLESVINWILKTRNLFVVLMKPDKKFIDALPGIDITDKEKCCKAINRLIGIYSFCSRTNYRNESSYKHYFVNQKIDKTKRESSWLVMPNELFDVFFLKMDKNGQYYDFNTGRKEPYISYIEAMLRLYPREEYVYIKSEFIFPSDKKDIFWTDDGYTLARYTCSGELCVEPLKGDWVKRISDSDFVPQNE